MTKKKIVIFGLGSGRCGSSSLAYLFNSQEGALVGHELGPIMPWDTSDLTGIQFRWEQLQHQSHLYPVVGDVGTYYLPYVPMLMRSLETVPFINQNYVIKFIVLKREREAVIESYLKHFAKQNNNPLQTEKEDDVRVDEWDECFPKYDGVTLKEAIGLFYDDYYKETERLTQLYPNNVQIFPTDYLNSTEGTLQILNFAGISKPKILYSIKRNTALETEKASFKKNIKSRKRKIRRQEKTR